MDGMTNEAQYIDGEAEAKAKAAAQAPPESDAELTPEEEEENRELVRRAQECYRIGIDATAEWRKVALEDLEFLAGDQWDPSIKGERDAQGRPALTVNRLPQFVRQVTNEQRQSKPAITVNPVDSGSDVRTAEVLQGVIRNIEYTSNADAAYAKAGECAAITGLGYWDVCAEYEDERSFEQRLVIKRIANTHAVVMDPGTKELAGDDARWVTISTDMSRGEWKSAYPDRELPRGGSWKAEGDAPADWVATDGVRVHEYRYIKDEPDTLLDLSEVSAELLAVLQAAQVDVSSGAVLASEIGDDLAKVLIQAGLSFRDTTRRTACWVKIVGDEVIERGEFAGKYLQLVRTVGTELTIANKTIYEGIVRHAKDSQRMHNFYVTAEAEAIALKPKAPWLVTPKQIEGYEEEWKSANQRPHSYLPYNAVPDAPPPQRIMAESNVSDVTNARMQSADDLKAVTGIYDGQLGARSNETSGRAILARQSQGQTANFHFQDNLGMAIRYTGRILIDLIPKIYAGPRVMRILGEDGKTHEMVPVNQPGEFRGEEVNIDLNAGKYDVAVSMGPSYHSRRQEAAAQLVELIKANPAVAQFAGDLLVESLDIPGGKEIAKRMRKMLPPEIRPPDDKQPPPQVLAQQLQQAMQMNQQLTEELKHTAEIVERNAHDAKSKERIELAKLHVDLLKTAATLDSAENVAMLKNEAAAISKRLQLSGFNEPVEGTQPQPQPPQGT